MLLIISILILLEMHVRIKIMHKKNEAVILFFIIYIKKVYLVGL